LFLLEVDAELGTSETATESTRLSASVENAERVCQEVRDLLAKVHSTLEHVRDVSAPESMNTTMAGILEALALREGGEDPLVAAVHRQVTIASESVFSMMMMHGVECDFNKVMSTYLKGKDGRNLSPKDSLERARELSNCLAHFLAERNARKKAAREQRRSAKGASSGRGAELRVVQPRALWELKLFFCNR
jgi:hypothetical protein